MLSRSAELTEIELKTASGERQFVCQKETDRVCSEARKKLSESRASEIYVLDSEGPALSSQGWAKLLARPGHKIFCIGGSYGFQKPDHELFSLAQGQLSLGPQTMSRDLSRIVLLEQIFRAQCILSGHPYHHT